MVKAKLSKKEIIILAVISLIVLLTLQHIEPQLVITKIFTKYSFIKDGILRFKPFEKITIRCNNPRWPTYDSHFNNEGFRDEDVPKDQEIIGIFGDSFVYGNCLSDTQTIDHLLETKLRNIGFDYKVLNFGVPGYNLRSSLSLINQMADKYKIKYSIVYFILDDDMIPCDISCQKSMEIKNPRKYRNFVDHKLKTYMVEQHKKYKELLRNNFKPLVEEKIIMTKLLDKTKMIFYLIHAHQDDLDQILSPVFDKYNITFTIDFANCYNNDKLCYVPLDGHPSQLKNSQIADIIAKKITYEESISQQKDRR